MPGKTEKKQQLRPMQVGVSEMAAQRMVKMARPICPVVEFDAQGNTTGDVSCQRELGGERGWWVRCEERGHNPYFTTITVPPKVVPIFEERGDGKRVKTGEEIIEQEPIVRLNVAQVAKSTRVNSGNGPAYAIEDKGFKLLSDVGYDDVCEYRNCELPVKHKTVYGGYCTERHARLIGADVRGVFLEVPNESPFYTRQMRDQRDEELRNVPLYER